ncbi:glutathione S-transferase N-terminal domain-containing protein [Mycetohabitans sp. B6]|uniref:glutathione S-transferase N-terminal domain-containing protein n=1 Tax=Mycetohabitans TaxID=2571159 RepID=UPI001E4DBC70|nr:glutathione S-transferase N-terminal domain-containing protein [Mycetohabitans rhizoxinica]
MLDSPSVRRIAITLKHLGLPFEYRPIDDIVSSGHRCMAACAFSHTLPTRTVGRLFLGRGRRRR